MFTFRSSFAHRPVLASCGGGGGDGGERFARSLKRSRTLSFQRSVRLRSDERVRAEALFLVSDLHSISDSFSRRRLRLLLCPSSSFAPWTLDEAYFRGN